MTERELRDCLAALAYVHPSSTKGTTAHCEVRPQDIRFAQRCSMRVSRRKDGTVLLTVKPGKSLMRDIQDAK